MTSSISGLSSSTVNDIRGYGGLASGLDRDSLIEGMTYGTQLKIAQQEQKKDLLEWEQDAIQNITTKMYEFGQKYTSFSSSTNLLGSTLFSRNSVTAVGENSKYIKVSGSDVAADTISILGVKSLAERAQMTSAEAVSDRTLDTGAFSMALDTEVDISKLEGTFFSVTYGDQNYLVSLPAEAEYDYSTPGAAADAINKAMGEVEVAGGKTLDEVMEIKYDEADGKFSFINHDDGGNKLEFASTSEAFLKTMGFMSSSEKFSDLDSDRISLTSGSLLAANDATLTGKTTLYSQFSEAKFQFEYNGKVEEIQLGKYTSATTVDNILEDMQKGLDDAFGKGRVEATLNKDTDANTAAFSFKTTTPSFDASGNLVYTDDNSSTLSIVGAQGGFFGSSGVLGIQAGESNRVNLNASIAQSGIADAVVDSSEDMIISNGAQSVNLTELGLNWDSSVQEIIDVINENEDLGITVSYQNESDKFIVTSTEDGASGYINLGGNVATALFGDDAGVAYAGKDAELLVKYAGSDEQITITRSSNTMEFDGLNITVTGTFGFWGTGGYDSSTEAVTFDAQVDTETATETVKDMITEYNEMLALIHDELGQTRDRDYAPLTDEQREEMSESQIEKWEEEAKKGLLFNDSDIRSLADSLRFIIPTSMYEQFKEIGISVSTNYEDNGKLIFDATVFEAALAADPENVEKLFTAEADATNSTPAGLMENMSTVIDRYASMTGATKGLLVERAGSIYSPTSVLQNSIQTEIDDIDDILATLQDRLETETDRYISQFTQLETLISEMNSQSSYLSSMFAY